jgi:hypothetical protein
MATAHTPIGFANEHTRQVLVVFAVVDDGEIVLCRLDVAETDGDVEIPQIEVVS